MPIYSPTGFLDITNATLRTSNTECQNLKIGTGNLYVTSEISPSYELNLSNVTSLGATSPHTLTLSNVTTAIDATSNIITSGNLKIGGLIYTKDWGIRGVAAGNNLYVGRFTVHGITEVLIIDQAANLGSASKFTITRNAGSPPLVNGIDSSSTINYEWYFISQSNNSEYDLWVRPSATVQTNIKVTSSTYIELESEPSSSGAIVCVNGLINMSGNVVASKNLTVSGNTFYTSPVSISVDSNVVTEYTGPHDRPLRKYPEVALTADAETDSGYKGYKVTVSSLGGGDGTGYRVFDGNYADASTVWGSGDFYNSSDGDATVSGAASTTVSGVSGAVIGEWIGLQLPNKIRLQDVKIAPQSYAGTLYGPPRTPTKGVVVGSIDGTNWELVHSFTTSGISQIPLDYLSSIGPINSIKYYNYFRIIAEEIVGGTNGTRFNLEELCFYGYEEGSGSLDTTLKSVYNVPATTGTQLEVYYDAKNYTGGTITDESPNSYVGTLNGNTQLETVDGIKAFKFDGNADTITGTVSGASGEYVHTITFWVKFNDFSTANTGYTLFEMGTRSNDDIIGLYAEPGKVNYYFYSNDNSYSLNGVSNGNLIHDQWYHFTATYSGGSDLSNRKLYINGNEIPRSTHGGASSGALTLANGNFAIGDIIGGTGLNDFAGSIANFRLYSKALNAGQVQELYDYQKDYFLGSKSQVTLYKGHLGVGVTEPSGQLELAGDERIQEYPPRALTHSDGTASGSQTARQTKNITYIEGHGEFKASASRWSVGTVGYDGQQPYNAFDNGTYGWIHYENAGYNNTTGAYEDNEYKLSASSGTPYGHWLKLEMPYTVNIKSYFLDGSGQNYSPHDWQIWASNDDNNWTHIHSYTGETYDASNGRYYTVSHTGHYKMFAIIVTSIHPGATLGGSPTDRIWIKEMKYFGTPGPTTLDKGSLTLGRSLDVPRVSRYDVDTETPRPEKLVLDYDTTVNSSPTDISGQGNHGAFYNGASYSPADKAFVFDGTDDLIRSTVQVSADFAHSVSVWIKVDTVGDNTFFSLGNETTVGTDLALKSSTVYTTASGFSFVFYGGDMTIPFSYSTGRWYHIVATRDTGGTFPNTQKFYIDGVDYSASASWSNSTSTTLALPTTATLLIGKILWATSAVFDGQISNFKLYSVALEPSEVRKLYNLGRTGRSMVISDTAVGIGKVPEAQLDVRGTARFDTISDFLKIDHPGSQLSIGRSDEYANEFKWYAWSDGCNWFTPYTGKSIYIGRDGQTISEFNFHNVTTVKQGSGIISSSDDRLKRDETFITNATNSILKLKPQTYIKKHRLPENENDTDIPEQYEAGLIAQDVWYDAPELRFLVHPSKDANPSETKPISPDPNDPTQDPDYSSWGTTQAYVNYEGFLPYLIKSNQEIYTELQAEKAKNEALEARITALENA